MFKKHEPQYGFVSSVDVNDIIDQIWNKKTLSISDAFELNEQRKLSGEDVYTILKYSSERSCTHNVITNTNWFIKASKNVDIKLGVGFEADVKRIAFEILSEWDEFVKSNKEYVGRKDIYTNKYTKNSQKISYCFFRSGKNKSVIADFNEETGNINFFPENLVYTGVLGSLKDANAVDVLASYIIHETVHNVDPKSYRDDYRQKQEDIKRQMDMGFPDAYYQSPTEFDAYSKQISYDLKNYANLSEENKIILHNWLSKGSLTDILSIIDTVRYGPFIASLESSNKKDYYARTLKQRIFNELQNV